MQVVSKEMLEAVARKGPASSREDLGGPESQGHNVLNFPPARIREAAGPTATADDRVPSGHRNTTLTSLAGTMRRRGFGEEAMYAALAVINREKCDTPLPEREVRTIARSVARYEPGDLDQRGLPRSAESHPIPRSIAAGEVRILLSVVVPERVDWLWEGRIPKGKLTIIDGDPGLGKSAITADLAARISAGLDLPDGTPCEAAGVVICSAEDGLADTIRPRLDAAGGAPARVLSLATVTDEEGLERPISIPEDVPIIEQGVERVGAALVVIDPIMAFLSGNTDSYRDQDVRRALAALAGLAERTGAAIVIVRHLNKSGGKNPVYRGGGSIGIIGAARSEMLVAKDPKDEDVRVLSVTKSNLAAPAPSLAYTLEEAENGAVRVVWLGESDLTAAELLGAGGEEQPSALEEAEDFLRNLLADGPMAHAAVQTAAKEAGIKMRTLKRAKEELGVVSFQMREQGKRGVQGWSWRLPDGQGDHVMD